MIISIPQSTFDSFANKRILVTGAGGNIAHHLISAISRVKCTIARVTRDRSRLAPLVGLARDEIIEGDIASEEFWNKILPGVDTIFHLAAQTSAYAAEKSPGADFQANVQPMVALLAACRRLGTCPIVIFAGTVTEVGFTRGELVSEDSADRPCTIYDIHKLTAEQYLRRYTRSGDVRGITLRLANVYGPGPSYSSADRGVLNQMVKRALNGEPVTIFGEGILLRDYVYVEDVAHAFLAAAKAVESLDGSALMVLTGNSVSIKAAFQMVVDQVFAISGKKSQVQSVPAPSGLLEIEDRSFVGSAEGIRKKIGWSSQIGLERGIKSIVEAYQ